MGCFQNEVSVFDIMESSYCRCFWVLDAALDYLDYATLPQQCISMPILVEGMIQMKLKCEIHGNNDAVSEINNKNDILLGLAFDPYLGGLAQLAKNI